MILSAYDHTTEVKTYSFNIYIYIIFFLNKTTFNHFKPNGNSVDIKDICDFNTVFTFVLNYFQ